MENIDTTGPEIGDAVVMEGVDAVIEIASVPSDQPRAAQGVFSIVDQYDEEHLVERQDGEEAWTVVVPSLL